MMKRGRIDYRCSFCGKTQEAVHRLIAGPGGVYICDECIALCQEIIDEEKVWSARPTSGEPSGTHWVATGGQPRGDAAAVPPAMSAGPDIADGGADDGTTADEAGVGLQAGLAPLVAEVAAARAAIERLARENGALRERLERGDGEPG